MNKILDKLEYEIAKMQGVMSRSNNHDAVALISLIDQVLDYTKTLEERLDRLDWRA